MRHQVSGRRLHSGGVDPHAMKTLVTRAISKGRRTLASSFQRRDLRVASSVPLISFSFDDAPCSSFDVGGPILEAHNARATYFMSLGLLGSQTELGLIAGPDHLARAVQAGHELGCHTFDHLDAWHTPSERYIASVDANSRALSTILPGYAFRVFAYPKSGARLGVKSALARRFDCCRGGGQSINSGVIDLNLLSACFLDQRAKVNIEFIRELIDCNARTNGWLIFAAHDISDRGSLFGCSAAFFEKVVRYSARSGAQLMPIGEACAQLRRGSL